MESLRLSGREASVLAFGMRDQPRHDKLSTGISTLFDRVSDSCIDTCCKQHNHAGERRMTR